MVRGPGPGGEIEVAGREPRQADRRQQRPHRQIFAVGDEMRLVVAADDLAAAARARRRCWSRRRRARPSLDVRPRPPVSSTSPGPSRLRRAQPLAPRRRSARRRPAVLQRLGHRRFRPEDQSLAAIAATGRATVRAAGAASSSKPGAPFVLLADIGLDDADRLATAPRVFGRPARTGSERSSSGSGNRRRPTIQRRRDSREPQRARQQDDDQRRQAVGADQPADGRARACRPASRRPDSRRSR